MGKKADRKLIPVPRQEAGPETSNPQNNPIGSGARAKVEQRLKQQVAAETAPCYHESVDAGELKEISPSAEVRLPARTGYTPRTCGSAITSEEKRAGLQGGTERILFVDDEEILAVMVETMLKRLGYGVVSTTSSAEALRLFKGDPNGFDLVITDYTMPYLTGLALAKKLLAIRPDVPIILCTGFSESLTEEMVKRAGIREFVQKPLVRREIAAAIRGVLDGTAATDRSCR